ncbi:MAG: response regulator [Proteobacteria bacterium]|nr:response regulator [Pseudomonadota bacterium]
MLELQQIQTQLKAVARVISCELDRVKDTLHYLACHTLELFKITPDDPKAINAWLEDKGFGVGEDGFFLSLPDLEAFRTGTLPKDALSYSWPPEMAQDPAARYRLYCHKNMGSMLMTLQERLPGTVCVYYQDITNTALQSPYIDQITAITPDFQWSDYHTYASVNPQANPERTVRWAPPHIDYAGQGLIIAASIPVYVADEFIGLWSIDVRVGNLIRPTILAPTRKSQLTCVVLCDGTVISSSQGVECRNMAKGEQALTNFRDLHTAFADVDPWELFELQSGTRPSKTDKGEYQIYWVNLHSMDWICITVLSKDDLLAAATEHFQQAFNSLGRGDPEASVGVGKLPSEMLEIGKAYNKMVTKLSQAHERLLLQKTELAREKANAEAANHAKTLFLANMSHELRTPLNGIVGMHQLLQTTPLNQEQEEYIELAIQSARRLTNLLGDILDLTRIEAGKISLTKEPFNLQQALLFTAQLFAPSCQQKDINCNFFVHDAVPHDVVGDVMRFQQIINNLIGNAIKFTDKGEVRLEVYPLPCEEPQNCRLLFSISDTGIGMDESGIDKLFDPFVQADGGYGRLYQGAGLGLSIVRQLVTLMGGHVEAASKPGVGTTFHLCLPFGRGDAMAAIAQPPASVTGRIDVHKPILLVEDDTVSRIAAKAILEKAGYRADAVTNGAEALKSLAETDYSLVLMDIQMPIMDGVEATRAIRSGKTGAHNTPIPIVALTAYAMPGDRDTFIAIGMNDYLVKPLQIEHLTAVISRWLGP